LSAPEYFHSCGFDADLIRAVAMRSDHDESARLVSAAPELFANQSFVSVPPSSTAETKGSLGGDLGSFFTNWEEMASRCFQKEGGPKEKQSSFLNGKKHQRGRERGIVV
jgi:hypothetical protein